MPARQILIQTVYDGIRSRILAGVYAPGCPLPAIRELEAAYGVGRATVRAALGLLQKESLIRCEARRRAIAAEPGTSWEELLRDRRNVLSYWHSAAHILPPVLTFLSHNRNPRTLPSYPSVSAGMHPGASTRLCDELTCVGGPLLASLLGLHLRYSYLPVFRGSRPEMHAEGAQIAEALASPVPVQSHVRRSFAQLWHTIHDAVRERAPRACDLPASSQLDLNWTPFPLLQKTYLRIYMETAARIGAGIYPAGSYLPSEGRFASHYGASVSTIRRAMKRLEETGLTRTMNGRGTRVLGEPDSARCAEMVPGALELRSALEASRLLCLILPWCAAKASRHTTEETLRTLTASLHHPRGMPLRTLFHFVVGMQRTPPMRMILAQLGSSCDWGLLVALRSRRTAFREALRLETENLLQLLTHKRHEEFAVQFALLYRDVPEADAFRRMFVPAGSFLAMPPPTRDFFADSLRDLH